MPSQFRVRSKRRPVQKLSLVIGLMMLILAGDVLYRVLVPLNAINPLWKEVTIGEPVINDWKYEGLDEEGYLRFYHNGQTALLPPTEHVLDADGQFVVLEGHTPSSLTFARPFAAIPVSWMAWGFAVLLISSAWITWRWRRRPKRIHFRSSPRSRTSRTAHQPTEPPTLRPKSRFRPTRRGFFR